MKLGANNQENADAAEYAVENILTLVPMSPQNRLHHLFKINKIEHLELLLTDLTQNLDLLKAEDFTFQTQEKQAKGTSILWFLGLLAYRGQPNPLLAVLKKFPSAFKEEDFTTHVHEANKKGMCVLWWLVAAAQQSPGMLITVLTQYPNVFKLEDFTTRAQVGPFKGKTMLQWLEVLAVRGNFAPLLTVLKQYKSNLNDKTVSSELSLLHDDNHPTLINKPDMIIKGPVQNITARPASHSKNEWICYLSEICSNGNPKPLLFELTQKPLMYKTSDFTKKAEEGRYKGKSALFILAIATVKGHSEALLVILKQFSKAFKPHDFTACVQEGPEQGQSPLWWLATASNPEALYTILTQYPGAFKREDFIASIQKSQYKSVSIMMLLAEAAVNGRPKALLEVLKQYLGIFKIEDFTKQAEVEHFKGKSALWFLAKGAYNGFPEALLSVLSQYPGAFKRVDFAAEAQDGSDKGINTLWWLAEAAAHENPEALMTVLTQYPGVFKKEDFIRQAPPDMYQGKNNIFAGEALKHSQDLIQPEKIVGGVADKYLRPENRTNLNPPQPITFIPKEKNQTQQEYYFKCFSLASLFSQAEQVASVHKHIEIEVAKGCKLSFYSQNLEVKPNIPCVFIMAGRKDNAHFLKPTEDVRTILVFSKENLKELTHPIPATLDYLIIENLHSATHGEFKEDELGLLTSRRISAFLFGYYYKIDYGIVCDDNIDKISLSNKPFSLDSSYVYKSLIEQLKLSLSVNVQTISNNIYVEKAQDNKLGSKIFAFNMRDLRELFPKPENLFYLLPPSSCIRWWGEDYFMQCMLHEVAKPLERQGFRTLTLEEFGGLYRLTQHRNSCKKVISTAEDWVEKRHIFLNGIDFSKIDHASQSHIHNGLQALIEIVKDRLEGAAKKNIWLAGLDIEIIHAKANHIKINQKNKRPLTYLNASEAFSTAKMELEKIKNILHQHQLNALKKFLESKEKPGHIAMCTGAGKTRLQIALAHLCSTKMRHPIFIVAPTKDLVQQTYNEFMQTHQDFSDCLSGALHKHEIIKVSSNQNDLSQGLLLKKHAYNQNVFIFCEESFKLFMASNRFFSPSVMIFDEYHDIAKETISDVMKKFQEFPDKHLIPIIGLSATPISKNHPLSNQLFTYTREEALRDARVAPIIIDVFKTNYSKSAYQKMLLVMSTFLETTFHPNGKLLCKKKGIIFVKNIKDAEALKLSIKRKLDIPVFAIHSNERGDLINEFKKCHAAVAIAVRKLRVGFDDPTVNYAIDLQNPQNADIFSQIVGRVMRVTKFDPKKIGYVIAFNAPNTSNFKITTDITAIERVSDVYKFKLVTLHKLRLYSHHLGKCLSAIKNIAKENSKNAMEKILSWNPFNALLNSLDKECNNFFVAYKKSLKNNLKSDENNLEAYDNYKNVDQLFSVLKNLDNKLMPTNQRFYEHEYLKEKNDPVKLLKSVSDIHKKLMELDGEEFISDNRALLRLNN